MHVGLWLPRLRSLAKSRAGATAIEYALIAALIGVVLLAAIQGLGSSVGKLFNSIGLGFTF